MEENQNQGIYEWRTTSRRLFIFAVIFLFSSTNGTSIAYGHPRVVSYIFASLYAICLVCCVQLEISGQAKIFVQLIHSPFMQSYWKWSEWKLHVARMNRTFEHAVFLFVCFCSLSTFTVTVCVSIYFSGSYCAFHILLIRSHFEVNAKFMCQSYNSS